jgi:hypothetical protein
MRVLYTLFFLVLTVLPAQAQVLTGDSIPVRLNSLDADRVNNNTQLVWKVTCSLDYANFEIQRSKDGVAYTTIHTFEADKLRCLAPFDFQEPGISETSFYRVRVGDLDGKFFNSRIVVVYGKMRGFDILFPGIVTTHISPVIISSATAGTTHIQITTLQGHMAFQKKAAVSKGNTTVSLPVEGLPRGYYIITVTNMFGTATSRRFARL